MTSNNLMNDKHKWLKQITNSSEIIQQQVCRQNIPIYWDALKTAYYSILKEAFPTLACFHLPSENMCNDTVADQPKQPPFHYKHIRVPIAFAISSVTAALLSLEAEKVGHKTDLYLVQDLSHYTYCSLASHCLYRLWVGQKAQLPYSSI